jgi:hypothetical protein
VGFGICQKKKWVLELNFQQGHKKKVDYKIKEMGKKQP